MLELITVQRIVDYFKSRKTEQVTGEATEEGPERSGDGVGLQYPHNKGEDLRPRHFKALEGLCHE